MAYTPSRFVHYLFKGWRKCVDLLDEQLVSSGALRLWRDAGKRPQRPTIEEAGRIGKLSNSLHAAVGAAIASREKRKVYQILW